MSKPRIVIPDDYPPVMGPSNAFKMLKYRADVAYHDTLPPSPEVLLERIGDAEHVVSIRSSVPYPAAVLEALPNLKLLSIWGTGTDHVDLEAAKRLGITVVNTPGVSARPQAANAARPANSFTINEQELMKDPEYRNARLQQARATMAQIYPDLAEELGLSAEEIDKLFTLMARQQLEMSEHSIVIRNGEQPPGEAEMRERTRIMSEINQRHQQELAASLGGRYQQWQDYQQTLGARQRVTQLRRTLEGSGLSLSDLQARPLVAAISAEQQRLGQELTALNRDIGSNPEQRARAQEENFRRQAESNARMIAAAEPHLDSRQLATFKSMLDSQLAMSRASYRAQRQQQEQAAAQGQPVQQGQRILIY